MKNGRLRILLFSLASGLLTLAGCARDGPVTSAPSEVVTVDGSKYRLGSEPLGGTGVIKLREEAKDQDDVVIVGRIGGSVVPWVAGRAAFSIVDLSLKSCAEIGSDDCPKPWDYC